MERTLAEILFVLSAGGFVAAIVAAAVAGIAGTVRYLSGRGFVALDENVEGRAGRET